MKNESCSRSVPGQIILGAFVILLGVLFLLDNLDVLDFHHAIAFWPAVFIVMGVVKLLDSRSTNGKLIGAALIGLGVMLTLKRLGFWYVSWHTMWPIILIMVGGAVVYKAVTGRRALAGAVPLKDLLKDAKDDGDSVLDVTAILGGFERRITTQNFRGGEVTAVMGGCELDMRGSSIQGEAVINVFAAMGGITIKVPPDWTVVLHGTPILGGFEEKTIAPPNNTKRLIIQGYAIMGGVEVRN